MRGGYQNGIFFISHFGIKIEEELSHDREIFGETPEEQYQYLKPRLMAAAISLVLLLLGGVLYLLGLTFGEVLAGAGSILFAVVTLVFGWAILRGLLGFASFGVLFSNNVVLGAVIFVLYITLGYFGGLIVAVIGLCRFLVLLKDRKHR